VRASDVTERELLRWIYQQVREACFTRNTKADREKRDAIMAEISKRVQPYK
jgi:hypothetical protein